MATHRALALLLMLLPVLASGAEPRPASGAVAAGALHLHLSTALTPAAPDSATLWQRRDQMRRFRSQLLADSARRLGGLPGDLAPAPAPAMDAAEMAAITALPLPPPAAPPDDAHAGAAGGAAADASAGRAEGTPSGQPPAGMSPPPISTHAEKEVAWPRSKARGRHSAADGYQGAIEATALAVLAGVAALWLVRRLRKSAHQRLPF